MKPNTRKAIKESFMLLLNQKPLSKITVKEIVANCGINRTRFLSPKLTEIYSAA